MWSRGPSTSRSRWHGLALAGAVGAALTLLAGTVSAASPAAETSDAPARGEAYMGISMDLTRGAVGDRSDAPEGDGASAPVPRQPTTGVQGIDVSHWQGSIDWNAVRDAGIEFAWIKATEGTSYTDDRFDTNYPAAHAAGVIRGAYHFALPDASGGAAQAEFFVNNGGAWSADDLTLPGILDIEANPYGDACYGLSTSAMQQWISDFYTTYKSLTSRDIVIYTSPSWWNSCTGGWSGMADKSPLAVAHWTSADSPTLPTGFSTWTVWQYTSTGSVSGISGDVDRDKFNGSRDRLLALANNTP